MCAMATIQVGAFARQFQLGFVPFSAVPVRVPFSWDMFTIPIERCGIEWQPPLPITKTGVPSLRSLAPALEWDPVYNAVPDYLAAAQFGCRFRTAQTNVRVTCLAKQRVVNYAFDCP
jgi:hypothetical protein